MIIDATGGGEVMSPQLEKVIKAGSENNNYAPESGLEELIMLYMRMQHAKAGWLGAKNFLVTTGVKEGLLVIGKFLEARASSVAIPAVAWGGYANIFNQLNYKINNYVYHSVDSIEKAIADNDVVVINNPHNPTGYSYSYSLIKKIVRFAKKHHCILLIDECLQNCIMKKSYRFSTCAEGAGTVITVDSLSKWAGMPGVRIGFAVSSEEWIANFTLLRSKILNPVSRIAQISAILDLPQVETWFQSMRYRAEICSAKLTPLLEKLGCIIIGWTTSYCWLKLPFTPVGDGNSLQIGSDVIKVMNGRFFGAAANFVRLSYFSCFDDLYSLLKNSTGRLE